MDIVNHGPISHLKLPDSWQEGDADSPYHGSLCRTFSPPGKEEEFVFNLWSRGVPLTNQGARQFADVLAKSDHPLSAEEIADLSEVLGNMGKAQHFELTEARTHSLDGRRVLVVHGYWRELDRISVGLFVPENEHHNVEEIYCLCEPSAYSTYAPVIKQLFDNLRWAPVK